MRIDLEKQIFFLANLLLFTPLNAYWDYLVYGLVHCYPLRGVDERCANN